MSNILYVLFVTSYPGIPIMNMKPPSGLVVRVSYPGSATFYVVNYDVMIYFVTVFRPILANRAKRTAMMTTEVKPPVVVVY